MSAIKINDLRSLIIKNPLLDERFFAVLQISAFDDDIY